MCARIDVFIYTYIQAHTYIWHIYMNKQDTDDRLCSFKEMKSKFHFTCFPQKGFSPGSKLTGKQTEKGIGSDVQDTLRSPNPG